MITRRLVLRMVFSVLVFLIFILSVSALVDQRRDKESLQTSVRFQLPFHGRQHIACGPYYPCGGLCTTHAAEPVNEAIDFDMPEGTNVYSAEAGLVLWAGWYTPHTNYGNLVLVQHNDGSTSYYAHLSSWDGRFVAGQSRVVKGQWLGESGKTGYTGGYPHLHFEVRDSGNHAVWIRDISGIHWYSGDSNWPCGNPPHRIDGFFGYGDGPTCEPLDQMSDMSISPEYIDYLTPSVTVRMRIGNRCSVRVGGTRYTLLWSLRVTDPQGGEHRWVVPVCYDGFDPGAVRDCAFTFEVPDFHDRVCRYNGSYRVQGLEYGISTGAPEPSEWIALQNPNSYLSGNCLNACCASGASAVQGAQLQGCPNYCGGQPGWTPTPTPRQVYTPTPTPQPPPGSWGIVLYEDNNCGGLYDQFQSNGCHNLINARNADSFTANFAYF